MSAVLEAAKTDAFLEHYGIKGMKWGVTRSSSSSGGSAGSVGAGGSVGKPGGDGGKPKLSKKQIAKRVGIGAAGAVGVAAAVAVLAKQGKSPAVIKSVGFDRAGYDANVRRAKSEQAQGYNQRTQQTVREHKARQDAGRAAAKASQDVWKQSVNSLLADMRQANREQDQYMRGLGLGAYVNNRD